MISISDFAPIAALDFSAIKAKLMHKAGESWSLERTKAVECEYRRFLYLMKIFPNEPTAPLVDVDTFWHHHILDTMQYASDCERAFGYFLHHKPDVGMGDEADEQVRVDKGARMRELYEATFGETCPAPQMGAAYCGAGVKAGTAYCGAGAAAATAYCGATVKADTAYCGAGIRAAAALAA
jgi:hypothetical protein